MSRRGLLALIVVLAAVVGALYWAGRSTTETTVLPPDAPLLAGFQKAEVRSIDVSCGGGPWTLRRDPTSGWNVAKPFVAEADSRRVDGLLTALAEAKAGKLVAESGAGLAAYGLEPPACTVRLTSAPDAGGHLVRLGRSSPVGSGRYALTEAGRVVLLDGSLADTLTQGVEAFRERRLIPIEPLTITRIRLERPSGPLVLEAHGDDWTMLAPIHDAAATVPCQSLARAITSIELESVEAGGPAIDARPDRRIAVAVAAGSGAERTGYVATAGLGGKRLGWRERGTLRGLFDEALARELEQGADAFRSKRILALSSPDVTSVVVERGGSRLTAHRPSQEAPWSGGAGSEAFLADGARVDAMIDRLRRLTATGFEAGPVRSAATGTIVASGASGELGRMSWGPLPPLPDAKGEWIWVTTPARPGVIFRVLATELGPVPSDAKDWTVPPAAGSTP